MNMRIDMGNVVHGNDRSPGAGVSSYEQARLPTALPLIPHTWPQRTILRSACNVATVSP